MTDTTSLRLYVLRLEASVKAHRAMAAEATHLLNETTRTLTKAKSALWIAENNVTLADIQLSEGEGIPFCETFAQFAKWLYKTYVDSPRTMPRFVEWNGYIHDGASALVGKRVETPGRMASFNTQAKEADRSTR